MYERSFFGYSADALIYDASTGSFSLDPNYDLTTDRLRFAVTDDDDSLDGDEHAAEVGEDANQTGVVTRLDGSTVASGQIYGEERFFLEAPDGSTISLDRIEIAGVKVGYLPSEPLQRGVTYDVVGGIDIDNILMSEGGADTRRTYDYYQTRSVPCFGPGTMICTDQGQVPVEWLETSDKVLTRDHGYQPIVWIGRTKLDADYFDQHSDARPVCIPAGSCGPNMPTHDLHVTGDHRLLFSSAKAEMLFFTNEVLLPAKTWSDSGQGWHFAPEGDYTLTHIACAHHQVIMAQGAWVETLFAGPETLRRLSTDDKERLEKALGPGGFNQQAARPCLSRREARVLMDPMTAPTLLRRSA